MKKNFEFNKMKFYGATAGSKIVAFCDAGGCDATSDCDGGSNCDANA